MPWTPKQARFMFARHPVIAERARQKHGSELVMDESDVPHRLARRHMQASDKKRGEK